MKGDKEAELSSPSFRNCPQHDDKSYNQISEGFVRNLMME